MMLIDGLRDVLVLVFSCGWRPWFVATINTDGCCLQIRGGIHVRTQSNY